VGRPDSNATEPIFLEEGERRDNVIHVYVVWSKWAQVDRIQRGEIILEAAERKLGVAEKSKITIALGLTPEEARSMGIAT
jgi:hypothetical protein